MKLKVRLSNFTRFTISMFVRWEKKIFSTMN